MKHLSDETFEMFLEEAFREGVFDLRDITFIDPYGMVGLLELGRYLESMGRRTGLLLPEADDVLRYLERMNFFRHAVPYFALDPASPPLSEKYLRRSHSDVLLEITSIRESDDIHFIVGTVRKRAHRILQTHLHYDERAIDGFIVALSEVCQNIIEHSQNTGFVGIQKYRFHRISRNVVKIAVMDLGIGFRQSLSVRVPVDDDLDAIDKALNQGFSRHADAGRGHGLAAVRRFVREWNGKLSIRSGEAKVSIIPGWSWGRDKEAPLPYFPGAQINIMLPEVLSDE